MNRSALLRWYDGAARDLPWRRTRDPYALLVSEVMLQQTQAARVVPYYERFLDAFPTARALATASPAAVLRCWSGLGYNRRALALRSAAEVVARRGWPADAAGLRALPGVGPYTAAAVASFAWDEPVAAVDTNVRRVIERWDGEARGPAALFVRAEGLVPRRRAAQWNQAMMELGAMVCTARAPRCDACPLARGCATHGAGRPCAGTAPSPRVPRPRFEDTDRWARGRVVAALVAGDEPPVLAGARWERVVAGLVRDGLVSDEQGVLRLPDSR